MKVKKLRNSDHTWLGFCSIGVSPGEWVSHGILMCCLLSGPQGSRVVWEWQTQQCLMTLRPLAFLFKTRLPFEALQNVMQKVTVSSGSEILILVKIYYEYNLYVLNQSSKMCCGFFCSFDFDIANYRLVFLDAQPISFHDWGAFRFFSRRWKLFSSVITRYFWNLAIQNEYRTVMKSS